MTPATSFRLACCRRPWVKERRHGFWSSAGGTAGEIIAAARLESKWDFVAIDPSAPMLDLAREHLAKAEVSDRVETVLGAVADLDRAPSFDAAIMIGVLHHLPGTPRSRIF